MLSSLNNFDPISYLSLDAASLSKEDIEQLRSGLTSKIGQFILLKFSQYLPEDKFEEITSLTNGVEMLRKLNEAIPNMDEKLQEELENFKKDYWANTGGQYV